MANKRISKKVKGTAVTAPLGDVVGGYKPSLHLDLEGVDVKQVEGIKPGEEVQVIVTGKVRRVTQEKRSRYDYEKNQKGPEVHTATIQIDDYKIVQVEDEKNEFVKMADDENEAEE